MPSVFLFENRYRVLKRHIVNDSVSNIKSRGPSINPCGTPDDVNLKGEKYMCAFRDFRCITEW